MRSLLHRLVAVAVVCVFASLPTLARIHDHVSTRDNTSGFRLSKNLERPHEKIGTAPLAALPAVHVVRDTSQYADIVAIAPAAVVDAAAHPLASRAPPVF